MRQIGEGVFAVGLASDLDELLYGDAAPHVLHPEWDER